MTWVFSVPHTSWVDMDAFQMTAKHQQDKNKTGKDFLMPHGLWTQRWSKPSFPNIHMCIIPAPEIMPLWQKKKPLPLSFNILLCYGWKKSFYMVKEHNKASSIQFFAALTPKTYGQSRQWCKIYKAWDYKTYSHNHWHLRHKR